MKLSDFRVGWRILLQERVYSAVVVGGLATGMAAFFLLLCYVQYSFSYNSQPPEAERLFVLKHKLNLLDKPQWMELMPLPYRDAVERSGMTDGVTAFVEQADSVVVDNRVQPVRLVAVDAAFPKMFGIAPLQGDLGAALARPDALAVTESTARKLFGSASALGRTVQVSGSTFTVVAVLPDPPGNTTVKYEALVGVRNAGWSEEERQSAYSEWGSLGGSIYVRLAPGADPAAVMQVLQKVSDNSPLRSKIPAPMIEQLGDKPLMEIRLGALRDAYFDRDVATSMGSGDRGDKRMVLGAAALAALILALAMTNYVNLATIRTVRRQREIAMRKVLGASAGRIVNQFLAESLIVSLVASALGLALAMFFLSDFSDLVNRRLESMVSWQMLLSALAIGAVVGLVAGLYPAAIALRQRISGVLSGRGNNESSAGLALRRALTILQFGTAMALIGITLAIVWQTQFATKLDPGFDPARLLSIDLVADMTDPASRAFRDDVERLPGVAGVTESMDAIGRANPMVGWEENVSAGGANVTIRTVDVGPDYFDVFQVAPVAGRLFDPARDTVEDSSSIVINAVAARTLGFASPQAAVGQHVALGQDRLDRQIVGVVPDMRLQTLREPTQAMVFRPGSQTTVLTVRGDGDMAQLQRAVTALWSRHFPTQVPSISLEQSYFAARYAEDVRLTRLFAVATLIAVLIAAFGIYVLSAYSVQRRAREIVLRRLYGATSAQIVRRLGREVGALIAISALLALPIAAAAIERYLASFVERAPMGAWPLLVALAGASVLAGVATVRHLVQAMRASPAAVLRN